MALFGKDPARVQPYFGYRSRDRLIISARALHCALPSFAGGARWRAMRTMLRQFTAPRAAGLEVELRLQKADAVLLRHSAVTDAEGHVHFDLPLHPELDLPPEPQWEAVALHWNTDEGPQCVEGHVLVPAGASRLAVISDIDDTLIETGITGNPRAVARNWKRVLAQWPADRLAVPGAQPLCGAPGGGGTLPDGAGDAGKRIAATHRPFFYVSSSPWSLFSCLVAFMRLKELPPGPLLLRDWGFNRAAFDSAGHGAHKTRAIDGLLAMYPEFRFALIGDNTQSGLAAYADAVEHNPQRIAAIFIRTLAGHRFTALEQAAKARIESAGVPLWLGDTYGVCREFLDTAGFTPGGETEAIMRAVARRNDEPRDG